MRNSVTNVPDRCQPEPRADHQPVEKAGVGRVNFCVDCVTGARSVLDCLDTCGKPGRCCCSPREPLHDTQQLRWIKVASVTWRGSRTSWSARRWRTHSSAASTCPAPGPGPPTAPSARSGARPTGAWWPRWSKEHLTMRLRPWPPPGSRSMPATGPAGPRSSAVRCCAGWPTCWNVTLRRTRGPRPWTPASVWSRPSTTWPTSPPASATSPVWPGPTPGGWSIPGAPTPSAGSSTPRSGSAS